MISKSGVIRKGLRSHPSYHIRAFGRCVRQKCKTRVLFPGDRVLLGVPVQVQKLYLAEGNDRLKMLVLYSGEDDERLRRAASGTLAMLTSEQPELCARIPGTVSFHPLPASIKHLIA